MDGRLPVDRIGDLLLELSRNDVHLVRVETEPCRCCQGPAISPDGLCSTTCRLDYFNLDSLDVTE